MSGTPGTETRGPAGPDAPAEEPAAPGGDEPMTNAPIPLAEEAPGVGLSRPNDEPDDAAGGRAL